MFGHIVPVRDRRQGGHLVGGRGRATSHGRGGGCRRHLGARGVGARRAVTARTWPGRRARSARPGGRCRPVGGAACAAGALARPAGSAAPAGVDPGAGSRWPSASRHGSGSPARMGEEFLGLRHGLRDLGSGHGVRRGRLPQHLRVLVGRHRHLHDQRLSLHPGLWVLPGRHPSPPAPRRRTSPNGWPRRWQQMGLAHAVVTCVARDDLDDGGAGAFAATIAAIRRRSPRTTVEVLISDCKGTPDRLAIMLRCPTRCAQPQHRDGGPPAAGRAAVGRLRPEPLRAGPGQGRRAHHQVGDHPGHGRDDGRGGGHPGRPAGGGRRHRDRRPVPAAERGASAGGPLVDARRVRRVPSRRRMAMGFAHVQASPLTRSSYHAREAAEASAAAAPTAVAVVGAGAGPVARRRRRRWTRCRPPRWPPRVADGRVRERMGELGVDALLLSHGADLPWLTGYRAMPLERLTMLVLPAEGEPVLVVPALEAPRVAAADDLFSLRPVVGRPRTRVDLVADCSAAVPVGRGAATLAISDRAWATTAPRPAGAAARRPLDRGLHGHLTDPRRQGRRRARRSAGRPAPPPTGWRRVLQAGEIPLVGGTEAAVSAPSRRPPDRGRPSAGQLRHRGQRAQCRQPASRARRAGHRAGETVVCDFGGAYSVDGDVGYCSDITRTVVTGPARRPRSRSATTVLPGAQQARRWPRPGPVSPPSTSTRGPAGHRGRRLGESLRPPDRARDRDRGARGPVPGGRQRRAPPARARLLGGAGHLPSRTASACGSRTSWSSATTANPSRSTPPTTSLVVVEA